MRPSLATAVLRVREALAPLGSALQDALRAHVREELAPREEALDAVREDFSDALARLRRLDAVSREALARYDLSPVDAQTTVHAALRRHPRAQEALARRGLPRCSDCAVGAEETLSEAAFGEGFDLEGLLAELNAPRR
jgi:hypothetical protein